MSGPNTDDMWGNRLMSHMKVLCKNIGPRPPTSEQERQGAEYVRETLGELGYQDIDEQKFHSQSSFGWATIPVLLLSTLAMPLGWLGGQWGKFIGGLILLGSAYILREFLLGKWPFFQWLIARGTSQNIITKIAPVEAAKRKVYLIGHLDSQKQRFLSPPPITGLFPILVTSLILSMALGGVFLFSDILFNRQGIPWWEWTICGLIAISLVSFLTDELQPHVEGANDNATAVSVLLTLAEILKKQPLRSAEVTFLFTGCEETICVGIESYLQQYKPPKDNTYWIDLEMVGTDNLCYITKHGVSHLTQYKPSPEMVQVAAQTAQKHPDLAVIGKDMIIVEEVANLRNRDYKAICIAGYNAKGYLPNWHRLSDNLENIDPRALSRANDFTLALLREIDDLAN
ncbi:MAG TPA: M28 family peptidase [Anaerolineales bacterium]|nr:M28 family peptidase [Anaerolineales bacterium]